MITEGLDWFSCSTPYEHADLVLLFRDYGWELDDAGAHRFYRKRLSGPHGITVFVHPRMRSLLPSMVELPGRFFAETGERGQKFAFWLGQLGVTINRIDWAIDLLSLPGSPEQVPWAERFCHVRGHPHDSVFYHADEFYTGFKTGKTEFVLRCYDKGWEQSEDFESMDRWWRIEWAIRGDLCKAQKWGATWEEYRAVAHSLLTKRFHCEHNAITCGSGGVSKPRSVPTERGKISFWLNRLKGAYKKILQIEKEKENGLPTGAASWDRDSQELPQGGQGELETPISRERVLGEHSRILGPGSVGGAGGQGHFGTRAGEQGHLLALCRAESGLTDEE